MPKGGAKKHIAKSKAVRKKAAIPQKQWKMPVSFSADGTKMATLKEHVDPDVPTLSLAEMTPNQLAEIVAKRIEAQPKYEITMLGEGSIDKQRALAEVKAQSRIGRALIEVEQRLINNLIERGIPRKGGKK